MPTIYVLRRNTKHIRFFLSEKFPLFLIVKISIYLQKYIWPQDNKAFLMLNSAEHEIRSASKSQITNNCNFFHTKHHENTPI